MTLSFKFCFFLRLLCSVLCKHSTTLVGALFAKVDNFFLLLSAVTVVALDTTHDSNVLST